MALGDAQIERYSRQIIVPRMGGRAQERLLASRLAVVGTLDALADPLAYLVGAGVGTIHLVVPDDASRVDTIAARMRDLNPDAVVRANLTAADNLDLTFAIIDSRPALDALGAIPVSALRGPGIIARLDAPARIAVLPAPPPCMRCAADGELLAPFGELAAEGEFVAMAATVEVLKFLGGYEPASGPSIVRFDGYASAAHQVTRSERRSVRCDCDGK